VLAGTAAGVTAVGAAAALAACGADSADSTADSGNGTSSTVTVSASTVPVGGAVIVGQVVVSQIAEGDFKAFSAVCTHQQCLVSRVQGQNVICTCHQSTYSAKDGTVLSGPAPRPLSARTVTQSGGSLTIT
jgi:Rieske Fe-S protein